MDDETFLKSINSLREKADFQAYIHQNEKNAFATSNGRIEQYYSGKYTKATVRCLRDRRFGESTSNNDSEEGIKKLALTAYLTAKFNERSNLEFYQGSDMQYIKTYEFDEDKIYSALINANNAIEVRADRAKIDTLINLIYGTTKISIINSVGGYGDYQIPYLQANAQVYLKESNKIVSGIRNYSTQDANQVDIIGLINSAYEEAKLKLGKQKRIDEIVSPVLFSSEAASRIITSLILAISVPHILDGKSFIRHPDRNKKIASEELTLLEDPNVGGSIFSRPFDDQMVPTSKKTLISNGIIKTYLHNLTTAKKFNIKPTGNYFYIYDFVNGALYSNSFITNVIVKNGVYETEELVKSIGKGIYVKNISMPNPSNGVFTTIFEGFYIENGEIKYTIKDGIIRSNLVEILKHIVECGKESKKIGPIITPPILVEGVSVASI